MTKQVLEPYQKSAGLFAVWALLAVLAWFFHLVGFVIITVFAVMALKQFLIEYELHKIVEGTADAGYEQPFIPGMESTPGTVMGTNGKGSLRENLPESKE